MPCIQKCRKPSSQQFQKNLKCSNAPQRYHFKEEFIQTFRIVEKFYAVSSIFQLFNNGTYYKTVVCFEVSLVTSRKPSFPRFYRQSQYVQRFILSIRCVGSGSVRLADIIRWSMDSFFSQTKDNIYKIICSLNISLVQRRHNCNL